MAATEPQARNLADLYELAPLDWADVRRTLEANLDQEPGTGGPDHHTFWLATADADGRPHMTAVGAFWLDGKYYFSAGPRTRKARNVERNPKCSLGVAVHGYDVALEGHAHRVTDDAMLQQAGRRLRRGRVGTHGRRRRLHPRVQRPERRPAALVRLRDDPRERLRRRHEGAGRRDALVLLIARGQT